MKLPSARTVGTVLLAFAMLFLVGVFVVQAAPSAIGAEESYVVLSGSMEPEISPGDAVVVKSVDPANVERGDVITYKRASDAKPVTHRVVEVVQQDGELAFRTKGDANEDPDPSLVAAENVVGQVWFTIPLVGHVVLFANTLLGRVVLVGLPLLALAVSELYNFLVARDEEQPGEQSEDPDIVADDADAGPGELFADEAADGESTSAADRAAADGTAADNAATHREAADSAVADESATASGDTPATAREGTPGSATGEPPVRSSGSDGITITTYDMRLSSVGFGLLAVYSGYMAFSNPTPVRVSIFAGAAMVLVFFAGMLLFGGGSPQPPRASRTDGGSATDGGTSTSDADETVGGEDDAA